MTCAEFSAVQAELALGLLTGEERANALAHVAECARCRAELVGLTTAADRVAQLAPGAEPSAGFEERVLAALGPAPVAVPTRRRRWPVLAAAAALFIVLGVAVGVLATRDHSRRREATMLSPRGVDVGDAYVSNDDPAWVFVSVPAWTDTWGDKSYDVVVTFADGTTTRLPGGNLTAGHGAWGTVLPDKGSTVQEVKMVGADGTVWCAATFT